MTYDPYDDSRRGRTRARPVRVADIVIGVTDAMRLFCFGSDPITFRA